MYVLDEDKCCLTLCFSKNFTEFYTPLKEHCKLLTLDDQIEEQFEIKL
jgi:hypothetical protein